MTVAACIVISLWIIVCLLFGMVLVYWVGYSHGVKRKHERKDGKTEITPYNGSEIKIEDGVRCNAPFSKEELEDCKALFEVHLK